MSSPHSLTDSVYIKHVAARLRSRQATNLRGQREHLEQLDRCSDIELVARFAWTIALFGGCVSYLLAPLLMITLQHVLPGSLQTTMWFIVKTAMALTGLLMGLAAWMTFGLHNHE